MKSSVDYIEEFTARWKKLNDKQFITQLKKFPPLAAEDEPEWDDEDYWINGLYRFLAFSSEAVRRRLRDAVPLLLDRATEFDQDNLLEGLRHDFENIFKPDWSALADICIEKAKSPRVGTRKWSLYQLMVLDDPRAADIFKAALKDKDGDIQGIAEIAIERLKAAVDKKKPPQPRKRKS